MQHSQSKGCLLLKNRDVDKISPSFFISCYVNFESPKWNTGCVVFSFASQRFPYIILQTPASVKQAQTVICFFLTDAARRYEVFSGP